MTRQQFIEEIKQLSVAERIALIEAITRSLREDLELEKEHGDAALPEAKQVAGQNSERGELTISQRLRGVIKFDGEPPTHEGLKDLYAGYLLEKYS